MELLTRYAVGIAGNVRARTFVPWLVRHMTIKRTICPVGQALAAVLFATAALGAGTVQQSGTVTPGHVAAWSTTGVIQDGGPATAGFLKELGITANGGLPDCITSAAAPAPYSQLCFGVTTGGPGYVTLNSYGGAANATLDFIINGTTYAFPGTGNGNVVGPNASVDGDLAVFNGTSGNLLKDGGPPSTAVKTVAGLKALTVNSGLVGAAVSLQGYYNAGDSPTVTYTLSGSACSLGAGAGDNGSQIQASVGGFCWLLAPTSMIDVRNFGVVTGGGENPNSNNAGQYTAAINYAATLTNSTTSRITVNGAGLVGISTNVEVANANAIVLRDVNLIPVGTVSWIAGAGSTTAHTYYLPNTSSFGTAGANVVQVWTPPDPFTGTNPVGMLDIPATSANIVIEHPFTNCLNQAGCAGITNNAYNTSILNPYNYNFATYGIWTSRALNVQGGYATEGSVVANWTGYGIYCAAASSGAKDSLVSNYIPNQSYQEFYVDSGCLDFHMDISHPWNGGFAPAAIPIGGLILGTFHNNGTLLTNTLDNGEIIVKTKNGAIPQVVIADSTVIGFSGSFDGWIVLQCDVTSNCGGGSFANTNPLQITGNLPGPAFTPGPIYADYVLEDSSGNYNPSAWSPYVQEYFAALNNGATSGIAPVNGTLGITGFTMTGNATTSSFNITGVNILPALGTAVTDSGNCLAAGTRLLDISYTGAAVYIYGSAPTGSCSSDTITIGSLSLTGTVSNTGNLVYRIPITAGFPNLASLYQGLSDSASGGCIPANSWIAGYNLHTATVIFDNASHTGATGNCTADTVVSVPTSYYPAPGDNGAIIAMNSFSAAETLGLRSTMPDGWYVNIALHGSANKLTITPLNSSTLNGLTSSVLVPDYRDTVDTLYSAANQSTAAYSIKVGDGVYQQAPTALSGIGTGAFTNTPTNSRSFAITAGAAGGTTGGVTMPLAPNGWSCTITDQTSPGLFSPRQSSSTAGSIGIGNYGFTTGTGTAWISGDVLLFNCAFF